MAQDNHTPSTPSLRPAPPQVSYQDMLREAATHSNVTSAVDDINRMAKTIDAALSSRPPALNGNLKDRLRESVQSSEAGKTMRQTLMTASLANSPEPKPMDKLSPEEYYDHVSNVNQQMNVLQRLATTAQGLTVSAVSNVSDRFNQAMMNQAAASNLRRQQLKQLQQFNHDPNSELGRQFALQNGGSTGLTMQRFEGQQAAIADSIFQQVQEEQVEEDQRENLVSAMNLQTEEQQVEALQETQAHEHVAAPHPGMKKAEEDGLEKVAEHALEKHHHLGHDGLHKLEKSVMEHDGKIGKMMHEIGHGGLENAMEHAKEDVSMFKHAEKAMQSMMKLAR